MQNENFNGGNGKAVSFASAVEMAAQLEQLRANVNLRPEGSSEPAKRKRQPNYTVAPRHDIKKTIQHLNKRWAGDKIPTESSPIELQQNFEAVRSMMDVGHTMEFASNAIGKPIRFGAQVARATLRQEIGMDEDGEDKYKEERTKLREDFIRKGYALAFKLIDACADENKIKMAPLKDVATALGIVMDKVLIATGKFEEKRTFEFAAIQQMSDEELGKFIGRAEGAIQFLTGRDGGPIGSRELKENTEGTGQ